MKVWGSRGVRQIADHGISMFRPQPTSACYVKSFNNGIRRGTYVKRSLQLRPNLKKAEAGRACVRVSSGWRQVRSLPPLPAPRLRQLPLGRQLLCDGFCQPVWILPKDAPLTAPDIYPEHPALPVRAGSARGPHPRLCGPPRGSPRATGNRIRRRGDAAGGSLQMALAQGLVVGPHQAARAPETRGDLRAREAQQLIRKQREVEDICIVPESWAQNPDNHRAF